MNIWINGGSRGLGKDLLCLLANEHNSITLLTNYVNVKNLPQNVQIIEKGKNLDELALNLGIFLQSNGSPDVVIHTAGGGMGKKNPILSFVEFDQVFYHNFSHIIEINHILLNHKSLDRNLKIIHIGSTASSQAIGSVSYNVAKATLASYVRSFGNEVIKLNVTAFGVNLGAYYTQDNSMHRLESGNLEQFNLFLNEKIPWHKMMNIDSVGSFFKFLVENDVYYMSGSMIPLDSGESRAYF